MDQEWSARSGESADNSSADHITEREGLQTRTDPGGGTGESGRVTWRTAGREEQEHMCAC